MAKRLVCLCNFIEKKEIVSALKKGAESTNHVQQFTGAGTSCGRCLPEIDQFIKAFQKEKPKDPQQKLDFGS